MSKLIKKVERVIRDFNMKWDLDLEISRIVFWNYDGAQYVQHKNMKGWIYINPEKSFQIIEEDVLHELGHALIHQYRVTNRDLQMFRDDSPLMNRNTVENKDDCDEIPLYGYVSWYAMVSGTEDFCECLSAWASNGYSMKNVIYGKHEIPVEDEPKLQKKFFQVKKILENV